MRVVSERADLARALSDFRMDELADLTRSSSQVAEAVGKLAQVLPGLGQGSGTHSHVS